MSTLIPRQFTNNGSNTATCVGETWQINSIGETSCQLWTHLGSLCSSNFTVEPLNAATYDMYPPAVDNECQCNVVAYNLMAACSWCQYGVPNGEWLSLYGWQAPCINNTFQWTLTSPLTANLTIPGWAKDTPSGTSWSPSEASYEAYLDSYDNSGSYSSSSWRQRELAAAILLIILPCLAILLMLTWCCVLVVFLYRQRERRGWYRNAAAYYEFRKYYIWAQREQAIEANHTRLAGAGGQFPPSQNPAMTVIPPSNTVPNPVPIPPHDSHSQPLSRSMDTNDNAEQMQEHGAIHVTSPASSSYGQGQRLMSRDVGNTDSALPYLPSSHDQQTVEEQHGLELSRKSGKDVVTKTEDEKSYHAI